MGRLSRTAVGVTLALSVLMAAAGTLATDALAGEAAAKDLNCRKCVQTKDLDKNSVVSNRVKDNSLTAKDMADDAKPAIAAASEVEGNFGSTIGISDDDSVIRTVTINAPGPGAIVATGGLNILNGDGDDIECLVSLTDTIVNTDDKLGNPGLAILPNVYVITDDHIIPVSQTRTFEVASAGAIPIFLACEARTGQSAEAMNAFLSAIYVPQQQGVVSEAIASDKGGFARSARPSSKAK